MSTGTFPNGEVTESALGILADASRGTIRELEQALESLRKVRDRADAAAVRGVNAGDMATIKSEALKAAHAQFLARRSGESVTAQVVRLIKHAEGTSA